MNLIKSAITARLNAKLAWSMTSIGVVIILLIVRLRAELKDRASHVLWFTLLHAEQFIAVAVVTGILHLWAGSFLETYPHKTELSWLWSSGAFQQFSLGFPQAMLLLPVIRIIWCIVITDIPGTPSEVIPKSIVNQDKYRYGECGFKNDGVFAFLSPILGTTPTLYYAENWILQDGDRYGWRVGVTAVSLFLLCFAVAWYSNTIGVSLQRIIPPVAVAPVLLYAGIHVIANSFIQEKKEIVDGRPLPPKRAKPLFFFPAAIVAILTPEIGLEFSFPLVILSFWISRVMLIRSLSRSS